VFPRYLIKLKPHKTALFEVSRHSVLLLNSKNEYELSELFLQVVFKCPPFALTKSFTLPLVFDPNFIFKTQHILFKLNFHDVRCDAVMMSSTD